MIGEAKRKEIDEAIELAMNNFDVNNADNLNLLAAVKLVVEPKFDDLSVQITKLNSRVDNAEENVGKLSDLLENYASKLLFRSLDNEVYQRSNTLIVSNIPGDKGETSNLTRQKMYQLDEDIFHTKATITDCHRLKYTMNNSKILVRFNKIEDRNHWLHNAKLLKNYDGFQRANISFSPHLPRDLQCLHDDILMQRKALSPEIRKLSRVNYLREFPYVNLQIKGNGTHGPITKLPSLSQEGLIKKILGE